MMCADEMIAGPVETTDDFEGLCKQTWLTAQCCIVPLGADGLLCTAA
jgi:hypothetical protein